MIGKIKTYAIILLTIVSIITGVFALVEKAAKLKAINRADNAEIELSVKTTEVITYQNKLGQTVTKTLQYERVISDLEFSNDSLERNLYRTVRASALKTKQIKEAYVVSLKAIGGGTYDSVVVQTVSEVQSDANPYGELYVVPVPTIKYFNDNYADIVIYEDSIKYTYDDDIVLIKAKRKVPRRMQPFKWAGWEWTKTIDKDMVEITSNNPRAKYNGRMIKLIN